MAESLTIASNAFFLLPSITAFYLRRYTRGVLYLLTGICSSMYHACNTYQNACLFPAQIHRGMDFFFAQLLIPLTALYIVYFPLEYEWIERVLTITFAFAIFVILITAGDVIYIQIILVAISLCIILGYWLVYACIYRGEFPKYRWSAFGMAIGLTTVSCALFATEMQVHVMYWAIHSLWHVDAALAQFFLLIMRPAAPKFATLDKQHEWPTMPQAKKRKHVHFTPPSRIK